MKAAIASQKWRPTLGMITAVVIISVVALPLVGLIFFRLYENQLVRQTEAELIAQSAALAAGFTQVIDEEANELPRGPRRPPSVSSLPTGRFRPIEPGLDLTSSPILSDRLDALAPASAHNPLSGTSVARLNRVLLQTQTITLAGFRILDAKGVVLAGGEDLGGSFAHADEVSAALLGHFKSVLRKRTSDSPRPPIYSISRGTRIRIFTAMPVFDADDRLVGVIYASRTPENIVKHLYRERDKVIFASLMVLTAGFLIWLGFVRTVTRPIRSLMARAEAIGRGSRDAIGPLSHHGTREVALLTDSFMTMAQRLSERSEYLQTFAAHVSHELKTPLTAIKGSAEILSDNGADLSPEARERFLNNITADVSRMTLMLERLRDLARADNPNVAGTSTLEATRSALLSQFPQLDVEVMGETETVLAISSENLLIVLFHMLDNAAQHSAQRVQLWVEPALDHETVHIIIRDDGDGVSEGNRDRVFEAFFTTRRDQGGTGMGLGIVSSMLGAHGGSIELMQRPGLRRRGAAFAITVPTSGVTQPSAASKLHEN